MSAETPFCSQCGAALDGDDRFCSECGAAVEPPTPVPATPTPPPAPTAPAVRSGRLSGPMIGGIAAIVAAAAVAGTMFFMGSDDSTDTSLSGGDTAVSTEGSTTTEGTIADAASGPITSIEDARQAVIRIETTGSFISPEGSQFNRAGGGSGFIISEDGLAVTNNHVVTGAGHHQGVPRR